MSNQYASVADIRDYLFPTGSSPIDDDMLGRLRDAACDTFDGMVGRTILTKTFNEVRNGHGEFAIPLYNSPITSVTTLTINGISIDPAPDDLSWGYVFDYTTLYIRAPYSTDMWDVSWPGGQFPINNFFFGRPTNFMKGLQNVKITYVAGVATVPQDIRQAIVELVSVWYKRKDHIDLTSMMSGGVTTTAYSKEAMPPSVCQTIDRYRRVTF